MWYFTALSVGFGLLLVGVESLRLPSWARRGVYAVAVSSYGAYLWHGLVTRVFDRSGFTLGGWGLDTLAYLAATLLVAEGDVRGGGEARPAAQALVDVARLPTLVLRT